MLHDFIAEHRDKILALASLRRADRYAPVPTQAELSQGLPAFLEQLRESLRRASSHEVVNHAELQRSASEHGDALYHKGATVTQVVHDFGDLCQVITGLAVKESRSIAAEEFQTLNLCLDDGIAGAVAAFAHRRERAITEQGTERLGVLAHEMRNLVSAAMLSFANIKRGIVAPGGSTSAIHDRSLTRLNSLIDRSLASVRLDAGMESLERVPVWEIIEEVEIGASMFAQQKGLAFAVGPVDRGVFVDADRQILAAAIANLLQNAFKFTRPNTTVSLTASSTETRVLIEVRDECGGLPRGKTEILLRPFERHGQDRSGLGLGLSICVQAAKAFGGELRVDDLPGKGCCFTIDLPKRPPPPADAGAAKPTTWPTSTNNGRQALGAGVPTAHRLDGRWPRLLSRVHADWTRERRQLSNIDNDTELRPASPGANVGAARFRS